VNGTVPKKFRSIHKVDKKWLAISDYSENVHDRLDNF
jgi:hypothetical protein